MPDHVHLVAVGQTSTADARRFISLAKQLSGHCYARQYGHTLWQRYAYERVVRGTESLAATVRYVLDNPLRSGLVKDLNAYPYVGSCVHPREELFGSLEDSSG